MDTSRRAGSGAALESGGVNVTRRVEAKAGGMQDGRGVPRQVSGGIGDRSMSASTEDGRRFGSSAPGQGPVTPGDLARQRTPEDTFRDEIARQIFGDIGTIKDDYSCAVEAKILLHGRLYVTDKFVCFYSNFFGFEKKIKIPYNHVLKVTKGNTALLIPNGINVVTTRKEYTFRSFWDRDECYYMVVNSFRAYKGLPLLSRESISDSRAINQDGQLEGGEASSGSKAAAGDRAATPVPPPSASSAPPPPPPAPPSTSAPSGAGPPTGAAPPGEEGGVRKPSPRERRAARAGGGGAPEAAGGDVGSAGGGGTESVSDEGEGGGSEGSTGDEEMLDYDDLVEGTQSVVSQDLAAAFEKALQDQPPLKEKGMDLHLRTTMQEFFEEFISDKAPMGLDKYHELQGDKEIDITAWEDVNEGVGATRSIRFMAALEGLPVGPSSAPVLKLQRLRVYGRHGMILETSSSMENVPAGDCFTVEDRWVMRTVTDSEGRLSGVSMQTSYEVKFTKGTLFRMVIESRSKTDTLNFHQKWYDMASKHLGRKRQDKGPSPPRKVKPPPAPAPEPQSLAMRVVRRLSEPTVAVVRRLSDPVGMATSTTAVVKRIKWGRLLALLLVLGALYMMLSLLVRSIIRGTAVPMGRAPSDLVGSLRADQLEELMNELRGLRSELKEVRSELLSKTSTLSTQVVQLTQEIQRLREG